MVKIQLPIAIMFLSTQTEINCVDLVELLLVCPFGKKIHINATIKATINQNKTIISVFVSFHCLVSVVVN